MMILRFGTLLLVTSMSFVPRVHAADEAYLSARSKQARCAALEGWYARIVQVAGPDALSPNISVNLMQKTTAQGFVDDVFVRAFGKPFAQLSASERKGIDKDIGSCKQPPGDESLRPYLQAAFSDDMRFSMVRGWKEEIPRAQANPATPASTRTAREITPAPAPARPQNRQPTTRDIEAVVPNLPLGEFDVRNRRYMRVVYADERMYVGANFLTGCILGMEYVVGIELPRDQELSQRMAQDVYDKVLIPITRRHCSRTDFDLYARFYPRSVSVTHQGEAVAVGSVEIPGELSYATTYLHREGRIPLKFGYGDGNGAPELATLEGMIAFGKNGGKFSRPAARPSVEYVNYRPSKPRASEAQLPYAILFQQMLERNYMGIQMNAAIDADSDPLAQPTRRGYTFAVMAFSRNCRASLEANPATFTPTWFEEVGTTTAQTTPWLKTVTRHMQQKYGETFYMASTWKPNFVITHGAEDILLTRLLFSSLKDLTVDAIIGGAYESLIVASMGPYHDTANSFIPAVGCTSSKRLIDNWNDFLNRAKPRARPNGDYPKVIERRIAEDSNTQVHTVSIGELPASEAPFHDYTPGTWLKVNYYGDRTGVLEAYWIRSVGGQVTLNCFYPGGEANYSLAGYPQPDPQRPIAARCPLRM
jgi:hypothetical protein